MFITLQSQYDNLEKILSFLESNIKMDCEIRKDLWDNSFWMRNDFSHEKCLLVKKNRRYGAKITFSDKETIKLQGVFRSGGIRIRGGLGRILHTLTKKQQQNVVNKVSIVLKNIQK